MEAKLTFASHNSLERRMRHSKIPRNAVITISDGPEFVPVNKRRRAASMPQKIVDSRLPKKRQGGRKKKRRGSVAWNV